MQYAVGPVLWYWPTPTLEEFYQQAARSSAEIIYLGEAVCSKRRATPYGRWMEMARDVAASGKQVVLSTLALLQSPSELKELQRYVENGEFLIEANDIGTVNMAAERHLPFVAGPTLNVYNADTLQLLVREGMTRWCMPVEMSRDWLLQLLEQCETRGIRQQFEVEVMGYGHLPLALSARCFTARSENRAKDDCETCCINYPTGRRVSSQEGRDWLLQLLEQCETRGIRQQFEVEVMGYGHLPLALSARCFTARSENRAKDDCETCCINYPTGRRVSSQEGQPVFVLNGIQTMSGYCYNLGNDLAGMREWVDCVRLSPQDSTTLAEIDRFRANENGQAPLMVAKGCDCNGYWRKLAGMTLAS
ncbi:U32 family peptidase [Pantoea sp. M_5]|nr:U32 family peptidase [Pantoea sp. M_5]KAA5995214.1 U32 family peptidase [Pantoea sp. M_5]